MPKVRRCFTIEFSHKGDSDWAVCENGEPVAWFSGTNAAERWIANQEREAARCVPPRKNSRSHKALDQ